MAEAHVLRLLVVSVVLSCASTGNACSSRWFPCNRPSPATPPPPEHEQSVLTTTLRPPIVYETKDCPEKFNDWYCLNGKCFMLYNEYFCNCDNGYMGLRCEHKYVDAETVLSSLRAAEIRELVTAVGPLLLVVIVFAICIWRLRRQKKDAEAVEAGDEVDGCPPRRVPFGPRHCEPLSAMVPPVPSRRSTTTSGSLQRTGNSKD